MKILYLERKVSREHETGADTLTVDTNGGIHKGTSDGHRALTVKALASKTTKFYNQPDLQERFATGISSYGGSATCKVRIRRPAHGGGICGSRLIRHFSPWVREKVCKVDHLKFKNSSALALGSREWQIECNRVMDSGIREMCVIILGWPPASYLLRGKSPDGPCWHMLTLEWGGG